MSLINADFLIEAICNLSAFIFPFCLFAFCLFLFLSRHCKEQLVPKIGKAICLTSCLFALRLFPFCPQISLIDADFFDSTQLSYFLPPFLPFTSYPILPYAFYLLLPFLPLCLLPFASSSLFAFTYLRFSARSASNPIKAKRPLFLIPPLGD
jgi:hypothetical protein